MMNINEARAKALNIMQSKNGYTPFMMLIDDIYFGFTKELLRLDEIQDRQIADLEAMLEKAIRLPKGVEAHSYSDYKKTIWNGKKR